MGKYYNLFGSGIDEGAERERTYQEAVVKYPAPRTCSDVQAAIQSISNEISSLNIKKTATISTGGSGRVEARAIDGYTRRKDELIAISNQWYCAQAFENQQTQQFLNTATKQLEAVQKISQNTDSTPTIVVLAALALTIGISVIIIIKRL